MGLDAGMQAGAKRVEVLLQVGNLAGPGRLVNLFVGSRHECGRASGGYSAGGDV